MATTPVSDAYLIPTATSVAVGSNLAVDSQENLSSTLSTNNFSVIQTTFSTASIVTIEVGTNLIADSQENLSSTLSTNNLSPVQNALSTLVIGSSINVASTPMSSTPTASEQLTKVQIWTIS